jgi:hypothetical protein
MAGEEGSLCEIAQVESDAMGLQTKNRGPAKAGIRGRATCGGDYGIRPSQCASSIAAQAKRD